MYPIAINWTTMTFPLLMSHLQKILFDRLGPVDLVLFTLLLNLLDLNLIATKGHTEILRCSTVPYVTYNTI